MKTLTVIALSIMATHATAQSNLAGGGYLSSLRKGSPTLFEQLIMPRVGELLQIGSPHVPGRLLQLVAYTGSWKARTVKGRLGLYAEQLIEQDRIVSIGAYSVFSVPVLGGKLSGPHYLGFKPSGSPWELNMPNSRLVWPVSHEVSAGLGWALNVRSGKPITFQLGTLVEWKRGEWCSRTRLGQFLSGPLTGSCQIRTEVFHKF